LLAEAFIRERRFDDAFEAAKKLPEGANKAIILREIRNNAVTVGKLALYQETSRILGLDEANPEDLATMLLVNVERQAIDEIEKIFNLLPENETKQNLLTTTVLELAYRGNMVACERVAKVCDIRLTKDQAAIAKVNAVRNGWLYDAERAAAVLGRELTKEEYTEMFVANKDKGLLFEAQEAAKRAGIEIDEAALVALLLAGVRYNRKRVWDVAEML